MLTETQTATKSFTDWDGVKIVKGAVLGTPVRRAYSKRRKAFFWNTVLNGRVTSVTVGAPPC